MKISRKFAWAARKELWTQSNRMHLANQGWIQSFFEWYCRGARKWHDYHCKSHKNRSLRHKKNIKTIRQMLIRQKSRVWALSTAFRRSAEACFVRTAGERCVYGYQSFRLIVRVRPKTSPAWLKLSSVGRAGNSTRLKCEWPWSGMCSRTSGSKPMCKFDIVWQVPGIIFPINHPTFPLHTGRGCIYRLR